MFSKELLKAHKEFKKKRKNGKWKEPSFTEVVNNIKGLKEALEHCVGAQLIIPLINESSVKAGKVIMKYFSKRGYSTSVEGNVIGAKVGKEVKRFRYWTIFIDNI